MQKSKIKVQNCGFGRCPKLFYAKEAIDISLFNEKWYVKKKSLFGQFELLFRETDQCNKPEQYLH